MNDVEKQLAGALGTALGSPATEVGALIADKIRFSRWKSGVRTLERANEIARERNIKLSQPDLKFLVPFMEYCSLEEEDTDVQEYWAQLLVSAGVDFKSGHLLFMRLLRELTGSEVRLLQDVATVGGKYQKPQASALFDAISNWEMLAAPASYLKALDSLKDWATVKEFSFDKFQRPGVAVEVLTLLELGDSSEGFVEIESTSVSDTIFRNHEQIPLDILVSLNLVQRVDVSYDRSDEEDRSGSYLRLEGTAFCLTAMGATFFSECSGEVSQFSV